MRRVIITLSYTGWFISESRSYINPTDLKDKVKFIFGIIPAWLKFTLAMYKAEN